MRWWALYFFVFLWGGSVSLCVSAVPYDDIDSLDMLYRVAYPILTKMITPPLPSASAPPSSDPPLFHEPYGRARGGAAQGGGSLTPPPPAYSATCLGQSPDAMARSAKELVAHTCRDQIVRQKEIQDVMEMLDHMENRCHKLTGLIQTPKGWFYEARYEGWLKGGASKAQIT